MSIGMSLLALLDEKPTFGLQLRNEFEARTGGVWPLNVGQVYTTLDRLARDGLVELESAPGSEGQRIYEITAGGRQRLKAWFEQPMKQVVPSRDELVLKLIMAEGRRAPAIGDVVQAERRAALELLQEYTRLKRDESDEAELGWLFLLDSLIFQTEARVRWLDACEARFARATPAASRLPSKTTRRTDRSEVTS